jgi:hypothetical protein
MADPVNTFKSPRQRAIGKVLTAVGNYAVPANATATIIGLSVCNKLAKAISIDVALHDGVNATYISQGAPLPAGSSLVPIGGIEKMVMQTGDSIRVAATEDAAVDVILSILETVG